MSNKNKKAKRPTLVLEGSDCSGKSTLAKDIQMRWQCKYIHVKQAPEGEDTLVHFIKAIKDIRQPTIIDRLHWSEEVYAKILRQGSLLDDRDFGVVDGYLLAHRGIIVHCNPPLATVIKSVNRDQDGENHNTETATKVWHMYNEGTRTVLPIIQYDYTKDDIDELLRRAQACMEIYYGG